ncbi:Rha family transcriptional regulator [Mannheimia bovis]|uniref:Rha family transcriptional regulator n=1 Tax=Mannheimia bovis TaxID=2770636 RepID=UPI0024B75910|nr:Rha family transcriptional regulator [Mannheimia bovis]WHP46368.1 Rha family transcriptional regulator [Mannheimia bovis]
MKMLEIKDFSQFVKVKGNQVITDSLTVSLVFGKSHRNVLRTIKNLDIPDEYRLLNFEQTDIERKNPSGGKPIKSPVIEMTKDGFLILVMGFTGKKAMKFKIAYIEAFNKMADYILNNNQELWGELNRLTLHLDTNQEKVGECASTMAKWKHIKPLLKEKIERIKQQLQPQLPFIV